MPGRPGMRNTAVGDLFPFYALNVVLDWSVSQSRYGWRGSSHYCYVNANLEIGSRTNTDARSK